MAGSSLLALIDDIATLEGLSQVAAAAFASFIAAGSYELFGLDNFSGLSTPINLRSVFSQKEYLKWNSLREKIDSRFIGLTVPRILMRLPFRTTSEDRRVGQGWR